MFDALISLPMRCLDALASALQDGALARDVSISSLQQIVGDDSPEVLRLLTSLRDKGMTTQQLSLLVSAVAAKGRMHPEPSGLFNLVLSGPDVAGLPTRDTSATIIAMVEKAAREILLVGYVVHRIRPLFARIADRMREIPGLHTKVFIDIPRKHNDTSLSSEIVKRFTAGFIKEHWQDEPFPELYYHLPSLSEDQSRRSSLHAKCVVVDRRVALVTSANFTEAAQQRNIELGVEVRHAPTAERICRYFEGLVADGVLVKTGL